MICFVFFLYFQPAAHAVAGLIASYRAPVPLVGVGVQMSIIIVSGAKVNLKVWQRDKDTDQDGHDVWRHVKCRYPNQERTPSEPASSPVASSPMYALWFFCGRFPVFLVCDHQYSSLC